MHLEPEAFLSLLSSGQDASLRHLLDCAACRRRLSSVLFDPAAEPAVGGADPGASEEDFARIAQKLLLRVFDVAPAEERRAAREAREAAALYDELLDLPAESRRQAVESDPRLRSPGLAANLLAAADEASAGDPLRSRHLAGLAAAILEPDPGTVHGRRLLASAYSLLAEAERRRGNLDLAEDLLKAAGREMSDEPLSTGSHARFCRVLAALRQDERRVDEALALLGRAASLAAILGDDQELARARLAEGWLLLDELDFEDALPPLREALHLSDPARHPDQVLSALHGLALGYAESGRDHALSETFRSLDALRPRLAQPLADARLLWIRAQVDWRRDERASALQNLHTVFNRFLREGPGTEAATAGLELARRLLEDAPHPSVPEALPRIAHNLATLGPDRLPTHLASVVAFALAFPQNGRRGFYMDVLLSATRYVEVAQWNSGLRYFPLPEPDLVLGWSDLSASQRQMAAETAGVRLDPLGEPGSVHERNLIAWTHEALTGVRIELPDGSEAALDDTHPD